MKTALALSLAFGIVGAASVRADEKAPAQPTPAPERSSDPAIKYKDGQLSLEFEKGGLSFSNRLQFRFTGQSPDAATQLPGTLGRGDSKGSFRIRRFEPQVQGWIYSKALTFKVELALQERPVPAEVPRLAGEVLQRDVLDLRVRLDVGGNGRIETDLRTEVGRRHPVTGRGEQDGPGGHCRDRGLRFRHPRAR